MENVLGIFLQLCAGVWITICHFFRQQQSYTPKAGWKNLARKETLDLQLTAYGSSDKVRLAVYVPYKRSHCAIEPICQEAWAAAQRLNLLFSALSNKNKWDVLCFPSNSVLKAMTTAKECTCVSNWIALWLLSAALKTISKLDDIQKHSPFYPPRLICFYFMSSMCDLNWLRFNFKSLYCPLPCNNENY